LRKKGDITHVAPSKLGVPTKNNGRGKKKTTRGTGRSNNVRKSTAKKRTTKGTWTKTKKRQPYNVGVKTSRPGTKKKKVDGKSTDLQRKQLSTLTSHGNLFQKGQKRGAQGPKVYYKKTEIAKKGERAKRTAVKKRKQEKKKKNTYWHWGRAILGEKTKNGNGMLSRKKRGKRWGRKTDDIEKTKGGRLS